MKKIKTFEDACKLEGLDPKKVIPDFSCYPEKDRKSMEAHAKLLIIVGAANKQDNEGKEWKPDFSNWDESKYEPWFDYDKGSSAFRYGDFVYWSTAASVGSRLCFKTRKTCERIANQFIDLYNDYLL